MCHIIISKHTYSECRLLDTAETGPMPSVPGGESSTPASAPHLPQLSRLMRSIHRSIINDPQTSSSAGLLSANTVPAKTSPEANIHVVTQKTFVQCPDARDPDNEDANIWDIHVNKRTCPDATEIDFGVDAVDEDDHAFKSELRGGCPVCEAVENAISQSLVKVTIVSPKSRDQTSSSCP